MSADAASPFDTMSGVQVGLEVAFYLYPCGLFVTLALAQLARHQRYNARSSPDVDEKRAERVNRVYNRIIRIAQALILPLLVCEYLEKLLASIM